MKAIKVDKVTLIKTLEQNRQKHRAIFEEALEGYKTAIIAWLEKRLELVKQGKIINHYIQMEQPKDQTKDYDRAIGMLKLSLDKQIELTEQDYSQYVLDDWSWKKQFLHSNSAYSKTATDMIAASGESDSE